MAGRADITGEGPDPGLANERTLLAWNRTALALAAIGALIVRASAGTATAVPGIALGVLILAAAGATWAYGLLVYRGNERALHVGGFVARPLALRIMAGATTVTACAAFLLALRI